MKFSKKFSKFAEVSGEELVTRLRELREGYMKMRFQHATGQIDSPIRLRAARKDIARALTALSQRRKSAASAPAGKVAK
jgi:large subunit ribosomal protein L29